MNKKYKKFQDLIKNKLLNDNDKIVWSQEPKNRNTLDCHSINYSIIDLSLKLSVSVKQINYIIILNCKTLNQDFVM